MQAEELTQYLNGPAAFSDLGVTPEAKPLESV